MPGFFSWISGLFYTDKPVLPAPEPRLFNPLREESSSTDAKASPELARQLEEHLF